MSTGLPPVAVQTAPGRVRTAPPYGTSRAAENVRNQHHSLRHPSGVRRTPGRPGGLQSASPCRKHGHHRELEGLRRAIGRSRGSRVLEPYTISRLATPISARELLRRSGEEGPPQFNAVVPQDYSPLHSLSYINDNGTSLANSFSPPVSTGARKPTLFRAPDGVDCRLRRTLDRDWRLKPWRARCCWRHSRWDCGSDG